MKNESLLKFKTEIVTVKEYLEHIENVNEVAKRDTSENQTTLYDVLKKLQDHYRKFRSKKRKFEYNATIITLYGILEKYIELWLHQYLTALSQILTYNQLPSKIQENHIKLSSILITKLIEGRWNKLRKLEKETVIKNLATCLQYTETLNYTINLEAFTISTGNLKHKKIVELFRNVGININKYLTDDNQDVVNNLVESRNQIAHGSSDQILHQSEIIPIIDSLEKYGQAIFETLEKEYTKQEAKYYFDTVPSENIIDVLDNTILLVTIQNYSIKKGDFLIIKKANEHFYKKKIKSLGKDNKKFELLKITKKTAIGIKLEDEKFKLKKTSTFYLAKK